MQAKTSFVTGATGFLGSFLTTFLLQKGYRVVALVRGPEPGKRLLRVLREVGGKEGDGAFIQQRLEVVEGDVQIPGLGLADEVRRRLAREVEEIWHCAASFKFRERERRNCCT